MFVAGFIGSPAMNFLEGRLLPGENSVELTLGNERLKLPASLLLSESPPSPTLSAVATRSAFARRR